MEAIPEEWIDNLFNCMKLFYGERWEKQFNKGTPLSIYITMWKSALHGCSYEEIKNTLVLLKNEARNHSSRLPPNQLEFFRLAKNKQIIISTPPTSVTMGNPEIARQAIAEMRKKLR